MKNGFTLIEMMAVVIIISLISILTVPTIVNQIAERKTEIDSTTKQMIYDATDLYMTNKAVDYPKLQGNVYCISLDTLVQNGYLTSPIKDFTSGNQIPLTKKVRVTVKNIAGSLEYSDYTLIDNC